MCTHLDHRAEDQHDNRTAALSPIRHRLDGPAPAERAWNDVLTADARRILTELAQLPEAVRRKRWRDLTGSEQRAIRGAVQLARSWSAAFRTGRGGVL